MPTVTCKRCKAGYGSFRTACPACGYAKPAPIATKADTSAYCAHCDKTRASVECDVCGELVHAKCYAEHSARHTADELNLMF